MTGSYQNKTVLLGLLISSLSLFGCAPGDSAPGDFVRDDTPNAVPKNEPLSRYGNPPSYTVMGRTYKVMQNANGFKEEGIASWYGTKFHGQRTSSGETYDMYAMTAAHKSLRIPTYVEVTNLRNNRKAIVKVNDRGPFHEGRVIDLSYAAATRLGVAEDGTEPVSIRVIETKNPLDGSDVVVGSVMPQSSVAKEAQVGELFYVQVAALSSEENALRLLNDLKGKKFRSVRIHVRSEERRVGKSVDLGGRRIIKKKKTNKKKKKNIKRVDITIARGGNRVQDGHKTLSKKQ